MIANASLELGKIADSGLQDNNMRDWLIPKLDKAPPIPFVTAMAKLTESIKTGTIVVTKVSDAPFWLRLLSRNGYCAYKNTVFVPEFHMYLVQSTSKDDTSVAMSKLLPWVMLASDGMVENFSGVFNSLYQLKTRCFYWLYEYFYLLASENKYTGLIRLGFMTTRKRFGLLKLTYDEVEYILNIYLGK